MQSLVYPQEHSRSANGWLKTSSEHQPAVALKSESEGRSKGSIVARPAFYAAVLAAGVWNIFAVGSPLASLVGITTFVINIGVGAAFLWVLLEPPYFHIANGRTRRLEARAMLSRLVLGLAPNDETGAVPRQPPP